MSGRPCGICAFEQVEALNTLLSTGTSARRAAQMYGLARSSVTRHAKHVAPASTPLKLIRASDDPSGLADPLSEALVLAERARTPRERLRAAEQIRASLRQRLRGLGSGLSGDDREMLDEQVARAERLYREAGDFETAARGLAGWREAIAQRLDALPAPDTIDVPVIVGLADGTPLDGGGPSAVWHMTASQYWHGIPQRFRDAERYAVERSIKLVIGSRQRNETIRVREIGTGALAWVNNADAVGGS